MPSRLKTEQDFQEVVWQELPMDFMIKSSGHRNFRKDLVCFWHSSYAKKGSGGNLMKN